MSFLPGTPLIAAVTFVVGGEDGAESPASHYWILAGVGAAWRSCGHPDHGARAGGGGITAATIAGQLTLSVVLDRMGVLGLDERAISWEKILGIALLAAGTVLIVRE